MKSPKQRAIVINDIDMYSAIAAVVTLLTIIFIIIIIRYTEDILDVFVRGKGNIPYPDQEEFI